MAASTASPTRQPTLFIPHGAGPCFFMDWDPPRAWDAMAAFLRSIPDLLPTRPRAIVVASAHWRAPQPCIGAQAAPGLLYDYHGFPPHTYALTYPAPGAPQLARQVHELLAGAGFEAVLDTERGLDHGVFIPLMLAFPQADIPVLPLSLLSSLDADAHLRLGRALAPLRDDNVLIIGSGMSYHNMHGHGSAYWTGVAEAFDQWLLQALSLPAAERWAALADWERASGPAGRLAHPPGAEEHLLPLHVALGAAGDDAATRVYAERLLTVDVSAFRFG